MSPKPRRQENRGLPARWRFKHGAYYYRVPDGLAELWEGKKEFRLGTSINEAYRVWAMHLDIFANAKTMAELLDRYALEVIPTKAWKSQESNLISIRKLKPVFGHMPIAAVKPIHVYQFRDKRGREGKSAANRDIEVLSHAFTKAIEWGLCEHHPIRGKVKKFSTPPRRRYIEDWEIEEALKVASPFIKAYIRLKLLVGLRRGDMLSIKISDLKEDGIHVTPRKTANSTGKKMIITWSDELRASIEEIKQLRKKIYSIWLFHTNKGQPYIKADSTANGFDSIWGRFMEKVLSGTKVQERFTEHDLRAKVASDNELVHAQRLLGHSSSSITEKIYVRKAYKVKPTK